MKNAKEAGKYLKGESGGLKDHGASMVRRVKENPKAHGIHGDFID